jgi:hypothetical protein
MTERDFERSWSARFLEGMGKRTRVSMILEELSPGSGGVHRLTVKDN